MATFTCWCGYIIRDNSSPQNVGHILWDSTEGFYEGIAQTVQAFYDVKEAGSASGWLNDFFGQQYPLDAKTSEVLHDIVLVQSHDFCSGIYRCPECRRVHIHIAGSENRWESFVPEDRVSVER